MKTVWLVIVCAVTGACLLEARVAAASDASPGAKGDRGIVVQTHMTTWMPRGRTLMDLDALIRNKLTSAGFTLVPEAKESQLPTLRIDYRETRGRQYDISTFGTIITCQVSLEDDTRGELLSYTVQESSGNQLFGTPPYIEAMQKFETNPYIYLLGDLVLGRAVLGMDTVESLVRGLERVTDREQSSQDPLSLPHTLTRAETGYAAEARDNTIEEVARLKDPRAVPVLVALLGDSDPRARRLSAKALGAIGVAESRTALEHAARTDRDPQVRSAAEAALSALDRASTK